MRHQEWDPSLDRSNIGCSKKTNPSFGLPWNHFSRLSFSLPYLSFFSRLSTCLVEKKSFSIKWRTLQDEHLCSVVKLRFVTGGMYFWSENPKLREFHQNSSKRLRMFAAILNQTIWIIVLCILCRLSFLDGPLQSASVEPRKELLRYTCLPTYPPSSIKLNSYAKACQSHLSGANPARHELGKHGENPWPNR